MNLETSATLVVTGALLLTLKSLSSKLCIRQLLHGLSSKASKHSQQKINAAVEPLLSPSAAAAEGFQPLSNLEQNFLFRGQNHFAFQVFFVHHKNKLYTVNSLSIQSRPSEDV